MSRPAGELTFLDTNILIRYLTRDAPEQAARAYALLQEVEQDRRRVTTTEAVIAEVVYVLSSKALYNVARPLIRQRLTDILNLRGLRLRDKAVYRRALELYEATALDFTDCLIVARMERGRIAEVFSFDRGFDRIPTITRVEP
jgi:predicted nucleic acid-binding protein